MTAADTMKLAPFAERIGVKLGTLKRWIHEGMDGVVRGPTGKATGIDLEAGDAWCAKKRTGRTWAFGRTTVVYFLRCRATGEIKIGFSQNVTGRVHEIKMKDRRDVDILATLPGDKSTEAAMHRAFAADRIGDSEWFRSSAALLTFIGRIEMGRAA